MGTNTQGPIASQGADKEESAFIPRLGLVLGSYELKKKLGAGSLAHVYLAEHTALKRKVALKILKTEAQAKKTSVRRFFAEARTVNQIEHENIVTITDFVEGPPNYFVMEYLDGRTLARYLFKDGALGFVQTLEVLKQLCSALHAVHSKGIVHRDLKPANIFLCEQEGKISEVKLLDFGIAKLADEIAAETGVKTNAGVLLGTPEYMSPEQAHAIPVDHRTDIYTVGLLAYEMMTGKRACGDERGRAALAFAQKGEIPAPSLLLEINDDLAQGLDEFVKGCCGIVPKSRYQSMSEVLEAIDLLQAKHDALSIRNPRKWLMPALAAGALSLGLVAYFATVRSELPPKELPAKNSVYENFVQLEVSTKPIGAKLVEKATGTTLGVTPLIVKVKKTDALQTYSLSKDGFVAYELRTRPDRDRAFSVQLDIAPPKLTAPKRAIRKSRVQKTKKRDSSLSEKKKKRSKLQKNRKVPLKGVDKVETMNPFAND